MVRCPWHYWEFDIRTGKSWFDPKRVQVRQFKAAVEPGAALVEGRTRPRLSRCGSRTITWWSRPEAPAGRLRGRGGARTE
ncbi:hypothetical protein ACFQU2_13435 [Siccirubricoccus deserti]